MLKTQNTDRFNQLLKALDTGWEIDEPVMIRATWRSSGDAAGSYHIILRQKAEDKTTLLSLPPSSELLSFLAARKIRVSTL